MGGVGERSFWAPTPVKLAIPYQVLLMKEASLHLAGRKTVISNSHMWLLLGVARNNDVCKMLLLHEYCIVFTEIKPSHPLSRSEVKGMAPLIVGATSCGATILHKYPLK